MNKIYCAQPLNKASKKKLLLDYFSKDTPATFNDPECIDMQCRPRKSRSIGDLKMLLDGAFKTETKEDDLIVMLIDLVSLLDKDHTVSCLYCSNINKLVFYSRNVHPSYWEYTIEDSSSNRWNDTKKRSLLDGYSWDSLLEIYKTKQNEQ